MYLLAYQVRIAVVDSGLCCRIRVTSFKRLIHFLCLLVRQGFIGIVYWFGGSAGIYGISSLQRMIIPEESFQLSAVHSLTETLCLQETRKTLRNLFLTLPSRRQPWPSPSTTGCGPLTAGRLILPSCSPLSSPKTLRFTQRETVAFATVSPHRVNADR